MGLQKGSLVAGRYRAERCVGAGGMGEVWEGEHVTLGSRVAIKTLLAGGEDNPELVARFRREAKLLGRCRSDHVARVVDFVQDPEIGMVLVMEFVEGRSLASVLEAKTMNIDEGLDLAIDLATALADLHRAKIVHRDIKPGNIIMHPIAAGGLRAVLVDFGISRLEGHDEENSLTGITRADIALGTVEYMAPEQILNSRQVTAASDVYAVGAILYRALSGRHVFGDRRDEALARAKLIDEPPSLAVGGRDPVAEGLCAIVDRALKKRPAARLPSGEQMLDLLLPLKAARRESDLDEETTADGDRTLARDLSIPDPRASLPSMPVGAVARPRLSDLREPESARRSLPGLELPPSVDARPRMGSLAEIAIEPPRPRVPWGTLSLAIATAFAVGAAVAVALVPQPDLPVEGMASAPSSSSARPSAEPPIPPLAATPCPAAPIDLDLEPNAPTASASAPKGTAPRSSGPALASRPTSTSPPNSTSPPGSLGPPSSGFPAAPAGSPPPSPPPPPPPPPGLPFVTPPSAPPAPPPAGTTASGGSTSSPPKSTTPKPPSPPAGGNPPTPPPAPVDSDVL